MKSLIIVALMSIAGSAFAADAQTTCKKISAMAGEAMEARQRGDLLEDAMSSVGDQSKFSNAVVVKAYGIPVAPDSKSRDKAVADFRNEAYGECYRNLIEPLK
ncbi:TPA: hypothetical protein SLP05_004535 [Pseudomonas putida]|uniref:hypothetical protein n=1 Tax=Pseudomonas putida TaxID=303 RepID=UPI00215FCDA3|nr:hypothetical protein [Pseudomonas putida]UVL76587.1 hypothetical protein LOY24_17845 [Pseudomonas putida]HEJ1056915.1 hypothetical protein [Pseudomonas putida]